MVDEIQILFLSLFSLFLQQLSFFCFSYVFCKWRYKETGKSEIGVVHLGTDQDEWEIRETEEDQVPFNGDPTA